MSRGKPTKRREIKRNKACFQKERRLAFFFRIFFVSYEICSILIKRFSECQQEMEQFAVCFFKRETSGTIFFISLY